MKKLPIIALVLFFICLLTIPAYGDVQHENQEGHQIGQTSRPKLDTALENSFQQVFEERRITLENGEEFVIVEVPDSWKKEMRVQFDKEGKAYVSCH